MLLRYKEEAKTVERSEPTECFTGVTNFVDEFIIKHGQIVKVSHLTSIYNKSIKTKSFTITATEIDT